VTGPPLGPPRKPRPPELVTRFGLEAEVLAHSHRGDDRHMVLKIERGGRPLVLKLYGRKRDAIRDFLRDFGHRAIVGKTGMTPEARMRTERATLELWTREGFDVPRLVDDVELPAEVPPLRLLFEFVPGEPAQLLFASGRVPLEAKVPRMEALAREWGRRHARALELDEPGLVQAHATIAHVLISPQADGTERVVTFDFEVAWQPRHSVKRLISLELAQNLDSLARRASAWHLEALIAAIVRAYPDRSRLERLPKDVRRGRLPVFSALTRLGLWLRERGPGRKLAALELLERELRRPAPIAR
jgi:hypothetical protein